MGESWVGEAGLIFIFIIFFVLVLPYINMHLPRVYTCSPSWTPLPPPSAPAPSFLYPASNQDWWLISYMILYIPRMCNSELQLCQPISFRNPNNLFNVGDYILAYFITEIIWPTSQIWKTGMDHSAKRLLTFCDLASLDLLLPLRVVSHGSKSSITIFHLLQVLMLLWYQFCPGNW